MNDVASGQILLVNALRGLIVVIRETRQRVLVSEASGVSETATDDDAVHDFRVALRRCRTMLRAARILWSSKQVRRIERELGYFASTTGTLRDDEVLRNTLASLSPAAVTLGAEHVWLEKRARAANSKRRNILRIVGVGPTRAEAASAKGKPIRALNIVLEKLDQLLDTEPTTACSAEELALVCVEKVLRDIRSAAQGEVHDVAAMHSLRIREKRLRYTAELFANELGEEGRRLVMHATRMQRRLGELHDFDDAITTVARARGLPKETQRAILSTLRVERAACAAKVEPHLIEARALDAPLVLSRNESPPHSAT